jgi:hypothetical protein
MDLKVDTCNPQVALKFYNYKFYSIVLPALLMFLVLEVVFVFMAIPTSIGNALTTAGPFPTSSVPLVSTK